MVNNEQTKIQNEKDLKFYRFMVAMTFVIAIVIALIVGITTIDSYKTEAKFTNAFIDMLMPKEFEGYEESGTAGMTFYREKNKEYDANKDEPLAAFNYYILSENGEKIYIKGGMYYPPQSFMEGSDVQPYPVYIGFYVKMMQNLQVFKNVLTVIVSILCIGIGVGLIYVWYRSWCRREDARKAREEEYNRRFSKK